MGGARPLQQLIPCDAVQFTEHDLQDRRISPGRSPWTAATTSFRSATTAWDDDARFWVLRDQFLPNSYLARTGDLSRVLRWSDFYTGSELNNAPFYAEYRNLREKYCMFVPLPSRPGRIRRVGFWRSNQDFSERDLLALQLLRPHLHDVYVDAERRRRGIPQLSPREREVLQLASQGYSNADIARILFISVATVAKHMEHIFDRTGVRTRTAAAAVALPQISPFAGRPDTRR